MPKPPQLPAIDWTDLLSRGVDYATWIANAEDAERGQRIADDAAQLVIPHATAAALRALPRRVTVAAIAEDWCGDVIRHAPVLQAMAEAAAGQIEVVWLSRDAAPELFVRLLTNGGEAIPKFVFLSETKVETGNWGPMPTACRELIARGKACGDVGSARKLVGKRYAADPDRLEVIDELFERLSIAATESLNPGD